MDTVKLIYKPVARRVTHWVLVDKNRSQSRPDQGQFGRFEVERLFSRVWDIYCELIPDELHLAMSGARMNMRMTCLSIAFFEVLSAAGIERTYAIELISEISWKTYDKWRFFSGMNPRARPEPDPQVDSDSRHSLPVPYCFPGGYREVIAPERGRMPYRSRPAR